MDIDKLTTSLIVVQPTPFCNIACSYCYLPHRNDRRTLTLGNVGRLFERVLSFPTIRERVTIVWHAGEPLVVGVDYYARAFGVIRDLCPPGLQVDHAFQTNGMLINAAWCNLFKEWNVGIGLSIDGPKHLHDAARVTRSGKGTYEKAVAGLRLLQAREIPFYVISVLTRQTLLEPDALFEFYRAMDIRDVGFNIEEQEGVHANSSLAQEDDLMSNFLARFSQLMEERRFPIVVRELEEALAAIRFLDCEGPVSNELMPFGIITIDVRGDVFTFSPELAGYSGKAFPSFAIGNVYEHSFEELRSSAVLHALINDINAGVDRCRAECKYFRVCGGGAPSNKFFENGTFASSETMYCRLTKQRVADFVVKTIEERLGPAT